jgi:hypothetical protein
VKITTNSNKSGGVTLTITHDSATHYTMTSSNNLAAADSRNTYSIDSNNGQIVTSTPP